MSDWPSSRAKKVRRALAKIGWEDKPGKKGGSHQQLVHATLPEFTWAFHEREEIGPKMLARIAKHTGLKPEDL